MLWAAIIRFPVEDYPYWSPFDRLRANGKRLCGIRQSVRAEPFDRTQARLVEA